MKPIPYSKACTAVKHLLPSGCRFLKIGEPIPAGTRYLDEEGLIQINALGSARLDAIHHPHFIEMATETVSDKILKAFELKIKELRALAKDAAKHECYELAAARSVRAQIMDEACGITMKAVRS